MQTSKDGCFGPCPYTANLWSKKGTLLEQWQSTELENLRQNFINGKQDSQCQRCWKEESAGKKSLRIRLKEFRQSNNLEDKVFRKYINAGHYKKFPLVLTLIPGNECNLACASCSGDFSSKWNSLTKQQDYGKFQKVTNNWNLANEQYQEIVDNSHKLQKIELFGGEPFLNKKNKTLLIDKLIEKGTSKEIKLYFNTNGTLYDADYMKRLTDHFKFVEIRLSMDGVGSQFEYLRSGAKYKNVIENAENFAKLSNSDFQIICTVSTFNIMSLSEINTLAKSKGWSIYYNIANTPNHILTHNIPEEIKQKINLDSNFSEITQYMRNKPCNNEEWKNFVQYTKILDKNRGTSFSKTFPELYNLVKKHGYE